MRNSFWSGNFCVALLCALGGGAFAGEAPGIPATLKAWKVPAYSQRYFLKVEAPGEAGNVGLHGEAAMASVWLPLKIDGTNGAQRPEHVALFGEDGLLQRVAVRRAKGGSQCEISFNTYPGLRRFCLYTGAEGKAPEQISPFNVRPGPADPRRTHDLQVRLRGVSAPAEFSNSPAPLSLKMFEEMEQATAGAPLVSGKLLASGDMRPDIQPNIDDAECPFFGISTDIFDHITMVANPQNYCALYEGFLRCPVSGEYKFALDTPGAAHLVIDGSPVLSLDRPDEHRAVFAPKTQVKLKLDEGVHRVVVHYAQAHPEPGKSDADTRRFGIRLHWQPPFADGLMCIPPLAFIADLPAAVERFERAPDAPQPFINVEVLGHVRAAAQDGDNAARELILVCATATELAPGQRITINPAGMPITGAVGEKKFCGWIPAGDLEFSLSNNDAGKRTITWPTLKTGAKDAMEREVMDLEAELLIKSAPEFLYPNESGHIHAESVLSPKPVIIHKTRFDTKYPISAANPQNIPGWEMLPPFPRPMGQFLLTVRVGGEPPAQFDITPDESIRRKKLISLDAAKLEREALQNTVRIGVALKMGGVLCQAHDFRMLHAKAEKFPGTLKVDGGELYFSASGNASGESAERVIMLVPQEDEASFRRLKPLDVFSNVGAPHDTLFLGDPLVEDSSAPAGTLIGLGARLKQAAPQTNWRAINVTGPHRSLPILRMLALLSESVANAPDAKLPPQVIVSLGSGDVSRQTPLHTYERALDTLLTRLKVRGAEAVIVVGPVPEAWRERQCEPYQERTNTVVRRHHASGVDLFHLWTSESDWARRYASAEAGGSPISLATLNAAALDEIVKTLLGRLK